MEAIMFIKSINKKFLSLIFSGLLITSPLATQAWQLPSYIENAPSWATEKLCEIKNYAAEKYNWKWLAVGAVAIAGCAYFYLKQKNDYPTNTVYHELTGEFTNIKEAINCIKSTIKSNSPKGTTGLENLINHLNNELNTHKGKVKTYTLANQYKSDDKQTIVFSITFTLINESGAPNTKYFVKVDIIGYLNMFFLKRYSVSFREITKT